MSRFRWVALLSIGLLFAILLLASAPFQTETPPAPTATSTPVPTPTPTATLTLVEHITVHGFDEQARERVVRDWGWGLLLVVLLILGGVGWWARPYVNRYVERRNEEVKTKFDNMLDGDPIARATSAYLERFDKKYSQFSFRGLEDVSGAKVPEFDAAYISLRLSTAVSKRRQRSLGGKTDEEKLIGEADVSPEIALDEAIGHKHCLAIVGSAGCGKSTLLQWAGVTSARFRLHGEKVMNEPEQISWVKSLGSKPPLPVFIALRDYVRYCNDPQSPREISPGSLVEFIKHFYTRLWTSIAFPEDFFKHHLRQGCLLLLDGVDEVSPDQRVEVREAVEGLIDDYGTTANRYLISSRSVAYRGVVEFKDFERLEVQPLSREQRDELIRFWCDAIYPIKDEAADYATDLSRSINKSDERVRQLARTPLMVSIFVLVYYHNRRRLPNQRAEFYYRAARVLVSETNKASAPDYPLWETISIETRIDLLKRVAYELYTRGKEDATLDELAKCIQDESSLQGSLETAKDFLEAASNRSGLLEERGGQYGFFTHKTFHEFLTALYIAQSKRKEWKEILSKYVPEDQWQEVLLLAAGALAYLNAPDAEEFIDLMSKLGEGETDALRLAGLERAAMAQADFPPDRAQGNRKPLTQRLEGLIIDIRVPTRQRTSLGLALGAIGDPRLDLLNPKMVKVEAGPFRMGTNAADEEKLKAQGVKEDYIWDDEKTGERDLIVQISYDYHIGMYPVTNAEYSAFVEAKGYSQVDGEQPAWWSEIGWRWRIGLWDTQDLSMYSEENQKILREWLANRPKEKRNQPFWWDDPKWNAANLPVVGVSWFEAEAYGNWLASVTGKAYRLPTEAEWEKAARWQPPLPGREGRGEGRLWPWGNAWEADKCNNSEPDDKIGQTSPVGMYPHGDSPYGALDMVGNVWEWCADWYDSKAYSKWLEADVIDPRAVEDSGTRVVRGGSWYNYRDYARCAFRYGYVPGYFGNDFGFRLALSPI